MIFFKIKKKSLLSTILGLIALLFLFSIAIVGVSATDYYVNGTTGNDNSGSGDSDNPYASIGKAINKTNTINGLNKIIVKDGTYNGNKNNKIIINKSVDIYGARYYYKNSQYGDTIINGDKDNWFFKISPNITVNFYGITFTNGTTALFINNSIVNIDKCNFKSNGYAEGSILTDWWGSEGSIVVKGSNSVLKVINSNFINNAAEKGAGIFAGPGSSVTVKMCNFTNNTAIFGGAAIYLDHDYFNKEIARVNISNSNFINNYAPILAVGGAISVEFGILKIYGCNFTNNYVDQTGGAISSFNGNVEINKCKFTNNSATGNPWNGGKGGAIGINGGKLSLLYSVFYQNSAKYGTIYFSPESILNVRNNNISKSEYGIFINSTKKYCMIGGNNINDCKYGIYNSGGSRSTSISSNNISNCDYGIYNKKLIPSIDNNKIFKCKYGIYNLGNKVFIWKNNISNCDYGIYNKGDYSKIERNSLKNIKKVGIYIGSHKTNITQNKISGIKKYYGIYIKKNSKYNIIYKNNVTKFKYGIFNNGYKSNIKYNKLSYNTGYGILIYKNPQYSYINSNTVFKNYYGIFNKGTHTSLIKNKVTYNKIGLATTKKTKYQNNYIKNNTKNKL